MGSGSGIRRTSGIYVATPERRCAALSTKASRIERDAR